MIPSTNVNGNSELNNGSLPRHKHEGKHHFFSQRLPSIKTTTAEIGSQG
jgi:hypothetical protein